MPWKRCIRWPLFLGPLVGMGALIYWLQPPAPRWSSHILDDQVGTIRPIRFSADGGVVYTCPHGPGRVIDELQSVETRPEGTFAFQAWNLETGRPGAAHPKAGYINTAPTFSQDGRFFAGECTSLRSDGRRFICCADLRSGAEFRVPLDKYMKSVDFRFSPCGDYFAVIVVPLLARDATLCIYETATGELVDKRATLCFLPSPTFTKEYLVHLAPRPSKGGYRIELWSLANRQASTALEGVLRDTIISPDGRFLLSLEYEAEEEFAQPVRWRVWNFADRKQHTEFKAEAGVTSALIAPNSKWVVIRGGLDDGAFITLAELDTGKQLGSATGAGLTSWMTLPPTVRC